MKCVKCAFIKKKKKTYIKIFDVDKKDHFSKEIKEPTKREK
jgi:hypothetical protein